MDALECECAPDRRIRAFVVSLIVHTIVFGLLTILANEDARWLTFSTARLRRFGYTLDSF